MDEFPLAEQAAHARTARQLRPLMARHGAHWRGTLTILGYLLPLIAMVVCAVYVATQSM